MARDYTKPGNTPPGTKHERPAPRERRTWLDVVKPPADFKLKDVPKMPTTVPFTRKVDGELVTRDEPFQPDARRQRRFAEKIRARRQRKGQKAFNRQQLEQARERETVAMLIRVAEGHTSATPAARANATEELRRRVEAMRRAE